MTDKLQPFDLERAKAGEPITCLSFRLQECRFIGKRAGGNIVIERGYVGEKWFLDEVQPSELRMLPRKVKRWHVITKRNSFTTENAAINDAAVQLANGSTTAHVIEHEWDE